MKNKIELLSKLLRELEIEVATRDMDILVLKSLIEAVKSFKFKDLNDFSEQFEELVSVVSNTEPKFGILNYHIAVLHNDFRRFQNVDKKLFEGDKWKKVVIQRIKELIKEAGGQKKRVLDSAEELDIEGKTILIHDHSHTVQDTLVHYRNMKKHFKVIIAEQDFEKTHSNIERMHRAQIPFQVVPAYMLSHIHNSVDMVFCGAVTLKDTMEFVMAPGTHGLISQFHMVNVPIYVFMNTLKFSLWKSKERGEVFIHKHTRKHLTKPIEYERIKYSHDRVEIGLFDKIISDGGILSPKETESLFWLKYKEYERMLKGV